MLLVIDAAYAEFVDDRDYNAGEELVRAGDNVVMLRTFSKIYGLAGLRLGWAFCPPSVADVLNRIRGPFNTSAPAQAAALAALDDRDHVAKSLAHNKTWRDWLGAEVSSAGLSRPSQRRQFPAGGIRAMPMPPTAFLKSRGLILRKMGAYGLPIACASPSAPRRRHGRWPRLWPTCRWQGGGREMSDPLFERVALIGLGLIGSSLARAMKQRRPRRPHRRHGAQRRDPRQGLRARLSRQHP